MKKKPLTEKQRLVLEFIKLFIDIKGFSPCLQEIATGLNMKSRSNIHRIVHYLKDRKHLTVDPDVECFYWWTSSYNHGRCL